MGAIYLERYGLKIYIELKPHVHWKSPPYDKKKALIRGQVEQRIKRITTKLEPEVTKMVENILVRSIPISKEKIKEQSEPSSCD